MAGAGRGSSGASLLRTTDGPPQAARDRRDAAALAREGLPPERSEAEPKADTHEHLIPHSSDHAPSRSSGSNNGICRHSSLSRLPAAASVAPSPNHDGDPGLARAPLPF